MSSARSIILVAHLRHPMFCSRCNRYILESTLIDHVLGHVMTQASDVQATIDNITAALTTALPVLRGHAAQVPPNLADLLVATQAVIDLTAASASVPAAPVEAV
jgi:hypothetical protein